MANRRGPTAKGEGISEANRQTFLAQVADGKSLRVATHAAGGFDRTSCRNLAQRDPEFDAALTVAREAGLASRADFVDQKVRGVGARH